MMKLFVVLSIAIVAVSASSKDELNTRMKDITRRTLVGFGGAVVLYSNNFKQRVANVITNYPKSAECVQQIALDPYFEFEAATVALMNELFEKVDTIEKAMEATEDDAASLETMEATLDSFESNYDSTDLVYNTLKPLIETVSQDAQSVCQCEEDGWCSSFQL